MVESTEEIDSDPLDSQIKNIQLDEEDEVNTSLQTTRI